MSYDVTVANRRALECAIRDRHFKPKTTDIDVWYKALNDAAQHGTWDDIINMIVQAIAEIEHLKEALKCHTDA